MDQVRFSGGHSVRSRRLILLAAAALLVGSSSSPPFEQAAKRTLRGRLTIGSDLVPRLEGASGSMPLTGKDKDLDSTLRDRRLAGRELEVYGTPQPDGGLEVERFFALRGGKPYRIIYFCDT